MVDIDKIDEYERGALDERETIKLFAELIRTGLVWTLQGDYGRTADAMISEGLVTPDGKIVDDEIVADDYFGEHTDAVVAAYARDAARAGVTMYG